MKQALVVLKKLVAIDTDSSEKKNYLKCAGLINKEAEKAGLKSRIIKFRGTDNKPRPNVLAELDVGAKETVLLLTHFDVVSAGEGWKTNPFRLTKKGSSVYARGVVDDKGAIACVLSALNCIGKESKKNVKFLAVCDEETGGKEGIGLLVKHKKHLLKADYCIALDGNIDYVSSACSGIISGKIFFEGKGGHAGMAFGNDNLLHRVIGFLEELKGFQKIAESKKSIFDAPKNPKGKKLSGRFNITGVHSGTKSNVLPNKAQVVFDLRILPEEKGSVVVKQFRAFVKKNAKKSGLKYKTSFNITNGYFSKNSAYEKEILVAAEKAVGKKLGVVAEFGGTDSRFISLTGIPAYNFAPGGKNMHASNENIPLRNIHITIEFLKNLLG